MALLVESSSSRDTRTPSKKNREYSKIESIDGSHSLKDAVPGIGVEYQVRTRSGGSVVYFNFALAKEMGLIPQDHADELNESLSKVLLDTFSIVIINEYDLSKKTSFPKNTIKKNTYMATRYLQLQHPNKRGTTSGDGRSIWNGEFRGRGGKCWDVTSCGTGGTCLSPAVARTGKFFKTGDPHVSYGCGTADLSDGVSALIFSEILNQRGLPTERTLALIGFEDGTSINVRVGENLIRPAHLFRYLKQNDHASLEKITNYFIQRQTRNGSWKFSQSGDRYQQTLERIVSDFAKASALFEREYIFCWLDWDGDNILLHQSGIIDYGSIRQFGLFHKDYRYDDVERWSTSILEQKKKSKYIIQTFVQLFDYLKTGQKKAIEDFKSHAALKRFDSTFQSTLDESLLVKMGFSTSLVTDLSKEASRVLRAFKKEYDFFERFQSVKGVFKTEDGVTSQAVFSMQDLLRELPKSCAENTQVLDAGAFFKLCISRLAKPKDLKRAMRHKGRVLRLQKTYRRLVQIASQLSKISEKRMLLEMTMRSSLINRFERMTGNGVIRVTDQILLEKHHEKPKKFYEIVHELISQQKVQSTSSKEEKAPKKTVLKLIEIVKESREDV